MAESAQIDRLRGTIQALVDHGVVPAMIGALEGARAKTEAALHQAVIDEVAAYTDSANPDVAPELDAHLSSQVEEIARLLGGRHQAEFAAVREHAERRAGQRFPLEALLHTYRLVHKMLFPWIRDAALASAPEDAHVRRVVAATADFAIEYIDCASTIATSSYVSHTRALAEAESDQRAELMSTLLRGYDESDSRTAQLLRRAGYLKQRQSYCVVAARSVNPDEMENAARAQRMADTVQDVLADTPFRLLIGVRDNYVVAIVSGTRRMSGWTAPRSAIADQLMPHLSKVGPAALIGVSNDVPSTSHVPRAAAEAQVALDFASYAERVKPYASVSLRQLLVSHGRVGIQSALPAWSDAFITADEKSRGRLTETLRAYADADMNVQRAAKQLGCHPNTIYSRAQRIQDLTGKNLLAYHDLTELLLAIDCR